LTKFAADDHRPPERAADLAEIADAVAKAETAHPQPDRPHFGEKAVYYFFAS
jgi:hypothetical protein